MLQQRRRQEAAKKPIDAGRGVKASGKFDIRGMMDDMEGFDNDDDDEEEEYNPDEDFM